jgi:hypothetical protein
MTRSRLLSSYLYNTHKTVKDKAGNSYRSVESVTVAVPWGERILSGACQVLIASRSPAFSVSANVHPLTLLSTWAKAPKSINRFCVCPV